MSGSVVRKEIRKSIVTVTPHRPEKRNPLSRMLFEELSHFPACVRAVILIGEGKHVRAGLDLSCLENTQGGPAGMRLDPFPPQGKH